MDGGVEDGAEEGCITAEEWTNVHEIKLESDPIFPNDERLNDADDCE